MVRAKIPSLRTSKSDARSPRAVSLIRNDPSVVTMVAGVGELGAPAIGRRSASYQLAGSQIAGIR
jgi:hypothetical protein